MGLSDATEKINVPTATAPVAMPNIEKTAIASGKVFDQKELQKKFAADGGSIRNTAEFPKELEGSNSAAIEFVSCLGNPAKKAPRVAPGGETVDAPTTVGYKLKALKDISVPVSQIKAGFRSLTDTEPVTWKNVKAGTTFDLNSNETGFLASQPEYAGTFTGADKTVVLSVKFAKDRNEVPLPVLRMVSGAIKDSFEEIAIQPDPANPKKFSVKPEYAEKFGVLFVARTAHKDTAGNTVGNGEARKNVAAAFNAYFRGRA